MDGKKISMKIFFGGSDVLLEEKVHTQKNFLLEIYLYCKKLIHFSSIPLSE